MSPGDKSIVLQVESYSPLYFEHILYTNGTTGED